MPRTAADQNKTDVIRKYLARRTRSTALEVVRGVKREMGVEVSPALAAKIKREAAPLPNGASKADQIRQVAKSLGRRVRPRDVIAKLAEGGTSVSSAQVSTVLTSMGMKKRRRRSGRRRVEVAASALSLESLLAAKKLADQLGGVEAAKTAVDALAKLS